MARDMTLFELQEDDEAMSKPVTMTPFELRKLYIETFPYCKYENTLTQRYVILSKRHKVAVSHPYTCSSVQLLCFIRHDIALNPHV